MMKSYHNQQKKGLAYIAAFFLAFLFLGSQEMSAQVTVGVVETVQDEQPSLDREAQDLRAQLENLVDGTLEHTTIEMKALLVESTAHLISVGNDELFAIEQSNIAILEIYPGMEAEAAQNFQELLEFMNISR